MVAILNAVKLERTAKGRERLARAPVGKPTKRLVGGHLHDLIACRKALVLTPEEARKLRPSRFGYYTSPRIPKCNGYSDASGEWCPSALLFLPPEKKG